MKKRTIVTLLDSNYLPKAIVTYLSLANYHRNFVLYAFCFDDLSYKVIKKLNYSNFIPIHTSDFENKELLNSKKTKEKMYEYYWSCKPFIIQWTMDQTNADMVTYIDCDFMFFSNPEILFKEADNSSVLIQPNNFSLDEVNQYSPVGYYCSCWESFKNNKKGRRVLSWWHNKCMDWCYAKFENDRFADQKYLDKWREIFSDVNEVTTVGGNVSPWNIQKYYLTQAKEKIYINGLWPLIYYHFHSFKINLINLNYTITGDRDNHYFIPKKSQKIIYTPYIRSIKNAIAIAKTVPEYLEYATNNPESNIKVSKNIKNVKFSSYKSTTTK